MNVFPPRLWVNKLYACKGTGLPRLAELIRKTQAKRHSNNEVIIEDFGGGAKFSCILGEHMGSQIYWRGSYSGSQLEVLSSYLRPGGVFIDLGANQGEFTVFAAQLVGDEGVVFSFEPSPKMRERLSRNIELNRFEQVSVQPFAVAEKPGNLSLHWPIEPFNDGTVHDGLPSLYAQADISTSNMDVEVVTLDDWQQEQQLTRIDVIKLDIEGAELPALRGGKGVINRFRPTLIIELNEATSRAAGYSMTDLVKWLQDHNYGVFRIEESGGLSELHVDDLTSFQNILATSRS